MNDDPSRLDFEPKGFFWGSRYAIGLLVLGAIAAYFLLTEHRAHFFDALPLLLLLACPLMHVFMHGGHGGHAGNQAHLPGGALGSDTPGTSKAVKTGEHP